MVEATTLTFWLAVIASAVVPLLLMVAEVVASSMARIVL